MTHLIMRLRQIVLAALALWGLSVQQGLADCANAFSERLRNHCYETRIKNKALPLPLAQIIDGSLKREGYAGLGLPGRVPKTVNRFYITPTFGHFRNFNGGLSRSIFGGAENYGFDALLEQETYAAGVNAGWYNRHLIGPGRYVQLQLGAGVMRGIDYDASQSSAFGTACLAWRMQGRTHFDGCFASQEQRPEFQQTKISTIRAGLSRLINQTGPINHEIGFSVARSQVKSWTDDITISGLTFGSQSEYRQNALKVFAKTVWQRDINTHFWAEIRAPAADLIVPRAAAAAYITKSVANRPLTMSLQTTQTKGGQDRRDITTNALISYQILPNLNLGFGRVWVNSSLNQLDSSYPVLNLQFKTLQF